MATESAMESAVSVDAPDKRVKLREKLSYAAGDIGSNLIFAPITSFLLFYLTNVAGIGAAIAGTVLLIGQLLNGVTDLIVGYFIDKTDTRWGKTRPWILFTALPMAIAFVMMFSVPAGLDDTGKVVWTLVMYSLVTAVFFTASNVAYSALVSLMTPSQRTRVTLTTFRIFAALATNVVVSLITLPLVQTIGGGQAGWTSVAAIYGVGSVLTMWIVFAGTRERVAPATEDVASARQPLRVMLRDLVRNRYFFLAAALFAVFYLLAGMTSGVGVYYATDILGDANLFGLLTLGQLLPVIIGIGFMPWFIAKLGTRRAFMIGAAVGILGSLIPSIAPTELSVVMVGLLVRGIGMVPFAAGMFALVADVVDYGEWKFGLRTDGLIYSSVVFGQKVGSGFGTAIVGWGLAWGGYVANTSTQPASAQQAILALYIYVPIALGAVIAIIMYFFKIDRHRPQIVAYLARNQRPPAVEATGE